MCTIIVGQAAFFFNTSDLTSNSSDRYRVRAQRFILTYSQVPATWDKEALGPHLKQLVFPQETPNEERLLVVEECLLISVEEHPTTGGFHLHVYLDAGDKIVINSPAYFDLDGVHPNIQAVKSTPYKVYEYVCKDGNIIFDEGDGPSRPTKKQSPDDIWGTIMAAANREEFLSLAGKLRPRDTVLHFHSLELYAAHRWRDTPDEYIPCPLTCNLDNYPQIADWVQANLNQKVTGRPKSLIIFGPTRIGKTIWARSLGKHAYFPGLFMLEGFSPTDSKYAVFDDMVNGIASIPNWKAWLGGQKEFVVGDKYMKKQRIKWDKPCIMVGNIDPREDMRQEDIEWLEGNCVIVPITSTLAEPTSEDETIIE